MAAEPKDRDGERVVVIAVPVLRRSHRIAPLLASIDAGTPEPHRIVFGVTLGDRPMLSAVHAAALERPNVEMRVFPPHRIGDYARKINGIAAATTEPFIFTGADDLHFHPGWLPAALAPMANPETCVVGTQDLAPTQRARTGQHATHLLVRRLYVELYGTIDEPGKIFHEGYPHEYVDDELVATAKARGAWAFAPDSVVEHLHPSWGKAPRDALYNQQRRRMAAGAVIFARRRRLWSR